jgi:2-polyprenyl-3-methyl-5-hydroxy-6-metoxy-1,4-benzoquinol methylase
LTQRLDQRIDQLHPFVDQWMHSTHLGIRSKNQEILDCMQTLLPRLEALESIKAANRLQQLDHLDIGARLMRIDQLEIARRLKQFTQLSRTNQLDQTRDSEQFKAILNRLDALEKMDVGSPQSSQSTRVPALPISEASEKLDLDSFYVDFEAQFRGSRDEIKQRLRVYEPYLKATAEQRSPDRLMFVDVGCGRGEWLELLSEHDIPSLGIDLNTRMVDTCLQSGYAAKVADAITFLQQQPKASIGGVTGFHIIEHLPFEKLIALFDAAYQALADGGLIIFETPNPENLIIGACNFYYDPTHLHPIVPEVAQFIAKQRGFKDVEIKRLHPFPDDYQMPGDSVIDKTLNKFLFSSQDYAVIARK